MTIFNSKIIKPKERASINITVQNTNEKLLLKVLKKNSKGVVYV